VDQVGTVERKEGGEEKDKEKEGRETKRKEKKIRGKKKEIRTREG
jgi:hypothetical protein